MPFRPHVYAAVRAETPPPVLRTDALLPDAFIDALAGPALELPVV
jgi:hypothetical protein